MASFIITTVLPLRASVTNPLCWLSLNVMFLVPTQSLPKENPTLTDA